MRTTHDAARGTPILVARDPRTIEQCLAAAAAAGAPLDVLREPAQVRASWRSARCVLVGAEMAALVCGISLEHRPGVHLVGASMEELARWSAMLQASVLVLPEQGSLLGSLLEQGHAGGGDGRVVRIVGGSGGVGASTLSCALAQQAAERGLRAAVVELDPAGGGLDVLFGAETAPGWRWHDLRAAAGHLDSLVGQLPNVSGVDVVSHARPHGLQVRADAPGEHGLPAPEAVRSVLACLTRTHDLVVVDGGRGEPGAADPWPGQRQWLLCGADVRGVVAAQSRAWQLGLHDVELVVRTGAARRLDPHLVAETLGVSLVGWIPDDRAVARAAEMGAPVARGRSRRGYRGRVASLLDSAVA